MTDRFKPKSILVLLCVITLNGAFGQSESHYPSFNSVIPASPSISEITKYGNYPVSYATGIPNIEISVYSYKGIGNGLDLDVKFSYHAGGIKVKQHASNVGLGWSLIAGGAITRSVNGLMDETPGKGLWNYALPLDDQVGNTPFETDLRPFNNIAAGVYDGQLDEFSFNFNGRSGSFYIGKNNDVLFNKQEKLKLSWDLGIPNIGGYTDKTIIRFRITDEYGVVYVFDNIEFTLALGAVHTGSKYGITGWYLSEIISPITLDKVLFEYDNASISNYSTGTSFSRGYFNFIVDRERLTTGTSATSFGTKRLRKISFPNRVEINVTYDGQSRIDLPGDHLMKSLLIDDLYNKRGFDLIQDYSLKRATLNQVVPYHLSGGQKIIEKGYVMEYLMESNVNNMPNPNSAIDHWGYFLDNLSSGEQLPYEVFPHGLDGAFYPAKFYLDGINRKTNANNVKLCSLKKMSYPTGGYTIFEMEANQADHWWLKQVATHTEIGPPEIERSSSVYVNSADPYKSNYRDIIYNGGINTTTNLVFSLGGASSSCSGCTVSIELHKLSGSNMTLLASTSILTSNATGKISIPNLIPGGAYRLVGYVNSSQSYSTNVNLKWMEEVVGENITHTYSDIQEFVGGLRVKSISDYDGISTIPKLVKEYEYKLEDGMSSGVLGYYPTYTYPLLMSYSNRNIGGYQHDPYHYIRSPFPLETRDVVIRSNNSVYSSVYTSGNIVTYSRVLEKVTNFQSLANNGYKIMHFTTKPAHIINTEPITPPQNASYGVGELIREDVFDGSNNLKSRLLNRYEFYDNPYYSNNVRKNNFRSISLLPAKVLIGYDDRTPPFGDAFSPFERPIYYVSSDYYPYSGRVELRESIQINYNGSDSTVVKKTFSYDPNEYYVLSDTLFSSKGHVLVTKYKYPKHFAQTGNVYSKMLTSSMINPKIETEKVSGTKVVSRERNNYIITGNNHVKLGSIELLDAQLNQNFKFAEFSKYSASGALEEFKRLNEPMTVYLWGYGGQYPIAEIKNATYAEVEAVLTQTTINNLNAVNVTEATITTAMNKLRTDTRLAKAMVTSYTYQPLVGMRSKTDTRGVTEFYEYDGMQRLKAILDDVKNVTSSMDYHYRPN